jgi:hypothetical protein
MSARDREMRCAQTAREHADPANAAEDCRDPGREAAGLAERLHAYGTALGDLATALADDLAEQAP